jgi:hypothetical protein
MWLGVNRANLIGDVEKKDSAKKVEVEVAEPHPSDFA